MAPIHENLTPDMAGYPGEVFEWGPVPTSSFDCDGYVKGTFGFDTGLLSGLNQCAWRKTQIMLSFAEL